MSYFILIGWYHVMVGVFVDKMSESNWPAPS